MRKIKVFAICILVLAIIYFAVAGFSFKTYQSLVTTFDYYALPHELLWQNETGKTVKTLWFAIILFSILGVIVSINFIGIFLAKKWARKFWLVTILILLIIHLLRFAVDFIWLMVFDVEISYLVLLIRLAEVVIIGLLTIISWRLLRKESVKILFNQTQSNI